VNKARDRCGLKGCSEPAEYVVELDGRLYMLCRGHFRALLKALEGLASSRGEASLRELSPEVLLSLKPVKVGGRRKQQ